MVSLDRIHAVLFVAALLLLALAAAPASAQSPAPAASDDPYAFFIGDWTCRTGYDNVVRKSYTRAGGSIEVRSVWGAQGGPVGGTVGETYGMNDATLIASTEFRGADGVQVVADYMSHGWEDGSLTFVGAYAGNVGHGLQRMRYTRVDTNTFERRFASGKPLRLTSVERCERGHVPPATAPTMEPG
jgi:hypothetical protein